MTELFSYDFMQRALTATVCMAVLCPVIGIFLVLRRTSMIGDALAHASLAGVAVGLAGGVNPVGASFIFTSAAALLIEALRGLFKNFSDLILTIVLALSVGIAVTLITSGAVHANAESFLFGSILTVTDEDLVIVGLLTAAALLLGALNYNALVCIAFDEEAARAAGVKVRLTAAVFALISAAAVASSIRVAGVLVMSSLLTVPVATALQFRQGFARTLAAAMIVSLIDSVGGLMLAAIVDAAPGGLIALTSVAVLAFVMTGRFVLYRLRRGSSSS